MKDKILQLREQYANAQNNRQLVEVDRQVKELAAKDPSTFASVMIELAGETADRAQELSMREQLKEILPAVSLSYIAKNYFGKTRQWLYQRINGTKVNGKAAQFNNHEKKILETALNDLGSKLSSWRASA